MTVTIEVSYATPAGLRYDYDAELKVGGLFVRVAPPAGLPPFAAVTVVLRVAGHAPVAAPARLTFATPESLCVEIEADARPLLGAAVEALCAGVAGAPGRTDVRLITGAAPAPATPAATDAPPPAAEDAPARAERAARDAARLPLAQRIQVLSVSEKMKLAMQGDRDARALLARDRAGPVQVGLVRNPKLTLDEAQAVARNPQLAAEAAEALLQHPSWGSSPQIALALVRNPRTPLPLALGLINRLAPADLRVIAKGLNVRTQVAQAARKRLFNT